MIDRCLRKAPADRFASAADIVVALARSDALPPRAITGWWRTHQVLAIGLYLTAAIVAWLIKESSRGFADQLFLLVGVFATVGGVFRGHLMFTERVNRAGFDAERRRALPVTLGVDLLIAAALAVDGLLIASARPLAAVLTIAIGVGTALARLVLERSTTSAAFGELS